MFSLGGGGVGKSYLIQTVAKWIDHILRKSNDNPDMPKVLLLAYTGVAAALIGKFQFSSCNRNIIQYHRDTDWPLFVGTSEELQKIIAGTLFFSSPVIFHIPDAGKFLKDIRQRRAELNRRADTKVSGISRCALEYIKPYSE